MDIPTRELIAIGASVTAHCEPCLAYHVDKAREVGVAPQEIREAVAVGKAVRQGAQAKMDQAIGKTLKAAGASAGAAKCASTAGPSCCD